MGAVWFISFNRKVTDEKFAGLLQTIVENNYGAYFEVVDSAGSWAVRPKESAIEDMCMRAKYSLGIYRAYNHKTDKAYKGKFLHKRMLGGPWSKWFTNQIHGHLCKEYGAKISTEDSLGAWQVDPTEHPTAREFLVASEEFYRENPEHLEKWLQRVPERIRGLRG